MMRNHFLIPNKIALLAASVLVREVNWGKLSFKNFLSHWIYIDEKLYKSIIYSALRMMWCDLLIFSERLRIDNSCIIHVNLIIGSFKNILNAQKWSPSMIYLFKVSQWNHRYTTIHIQIACKGSLYKTSWMLCMKVMWYNFFFVDDWVE